MTIPIKLRSTKRYTDNDEPERGRARAISLLGKEYKERGAAQSDNSFEAPANAATDYDLLCRIKPPEQKFKFKRPDGK